METIQMKRERRNAKAKELRALLDNHPGDKWTEDCQKTYDAGMTEITAIDGEIAREQQLLDLGAEKAFKAAGVREIDTGVDGKDVTRLRAVHDKWLRGGDRALNQDDFAILNTMSTTTDSEGGYTVPDEIAASIIDSLKDFTGVRPVANIITAKDGRKMSFPTSDGTAEEGELVAENVEAGAADPVFGTAAIDTYKFGSKVIAVPIELLQDSSSNVEAFVNKRIRDRLGRITNKYFTTGTGTAQPFGVVARAAAGKVGASTTAVTYGELVDLVHSVDAAYRASGKCVFMMNDLTVAELRKLLDGNNRPIWVPSDDKGIAQGIAGNLLGYPVHVNNHMATMAASAKAILFGDFDFYTIRDVMQVSLFRFTDSAYTKKGQVGFLAWMRSGGNLLDTTAVKYFQNAAA